MPASAFRYFLTLRLHAPYALTILLTVLVVGLYLALANPPAGLDDGLGMVLFVQMFLASTGFMERARRGHFDPLLTVSQSRAGALAAHWLVSILPGVVGCTLMCAAGVATGASATWTRAFGARWAALFIVSALAWVAGFAMARGTAGFLWTAALFATALQRSELLTSVSPAVILFCPFVLIRNDPIEAWRIAVAAVLALVTLLLVWRRGRNLDLNLVEQS